MAQPTGADNPTVAQATPERAQQWLAACADPRMRHALTYALFGRCAPPEGALEATYLALEGLVYALPDDVAANWAVEVGLAPGPDTYLRALDGVPNHWESAAYRLKRWRAAWNWSTVLAFLVAAVAVLMLNQLFLSIYHP